jgi:hypothetical protein
MKGFSRRETIDYYRNIMERAWQQVEQAATPEVKGQLFDQNLEWTMLDREYDDRTRRVFTGPIFIPTWWGRYDPTWRGAPTTTIPTSGPSATRLHGVTWRRLCRLGCRRRADLLAESHRQRAGLHQPRHQCDESAAKANLDGRLARRAERWPLLRVRLCLRRLRLCMCRWRTMRLAIYDFRFATWKYQ